MDATFLKHVNPHSLEVVTAKLEPSLASATPEQRFQFERLGYFTLDAQDSADPAGRSSTAPSRSRTPGPRGKG